MTFSIIARFAERGQFGMAVSSLTPPFTFMLISRKALKPCRNYVI